MADIDIDFSTYDTFVKTSGVERNEHSLVFYKKHYEPAEDFKWVSRKELLEILGVGKNALSRAIEQVKSSCPIDRATEGQLKSNQHLRALNEEQLKNSCLTDETAESQLKNSCRFDALTKKGGYNNHETFYREDLVKLIQLQLMKNQTHQGKSNELITEVVDSAVKEKLADSKAEDIKLAEINLAIEKEKSIQQENRAIAEKEISKQMRMLLKNENLKKDLDKFRTDAIKIIHYSNTETSKLYIGVDVASPSNYKIGVASNTHRRESIGTTDNPNLKYIYMKDVGSKGAAESLEKTIHEELKEYNLKNFRPNIKPTEWFILTPEKLAFIVRKYDFLPYDLVKNGINS